MKAIKSFFSKIADWVRHHRRRVIQLYTALLYNANFKTFVKGGIYTGDSKYLCLPGFNCYSCPGAIGSCPLGSLQNALESSSTRTPIFVLGCIMLWGLSLGRTICGFFCPVGFAQEIAYKIRTPKLKKNKWTRIASYLKYVILGIFVIAFPVMYGLLEFPVPGFCKYICPVGTLEGAIAMLINSNNKALLGMLGPLFTWKFLVLVVIFVASIFAYRFFCRFICPLGAIYGFFSRIALIGVELDETTCTNCGLCLDRCKMDIRHVGDHECINCGECIPVCPVNAISWKGGKLFLAPNAVEATAPATNLNVQKLVANNPAPAEETPAPAPEPVKEVKRPAPQKKEPARLKKPFAIGVPIVMTAVLVGAVVYFNFIDTSSDIGPVTHLDIGDKAVDHTFELCRDEGEYTISSSAGKITFLNFWYMDCAPCKGEIPFFNQIYNEHSDILDVVILDGVDEDVEEVSDFVNGNVNGNDWSTYTVKFGMDYNSEYYNLFGSAATRVFPLTVVLDQTGTIYDVHYGGMSYANLEQYIVDLTK